LLHIRDREESIGDRVVERGIVGEGEIMDNLVDVMERPSHGTSNRCDFEGDAVRGETPAAESIPKLDRREERPRKAKPLVKVLCSSVASS